MTTIWYANPVTFPRAVKTARFQTVPLPRFGGAFFFGRFGVILLRVLIRRLSLALLPLPAVAHIVR